MTLTPPSMPPLLEEEIFTKEDENQTSYSGTSCESIVTSHFLYQNKNAAVPLVDTGVDLLIEREPGIWSRGQVKKVSHRYRQFDNPESVKYGQTPYHVYYFPYNSNDFSLTPNDVDYFYHVLKTPLREMIWEVPASVVSLREDGSFIRLKDVRLDSVTKERGRKADFEINDYLISCKYDTKIFQKYPNFFNPITINHFMKE